MIKAMANQLKIKIIMRIILMKNANAKAKECLFSTSCYKSKLGLILACKMPRSVLKMFLLNESAKFFYSQLQYSISLLASTALIENFDFRQQKSFSLT